MATAAAHAGRGVELETDAGNDFRVLEHVQVWLCALIAESPAGDFTQNNSLSPS